MDVFSCVRSQWTHKENSANRTLPYSGYFSLIYVNNLRVSSFVQGLAIHNELLANC